MGITKNYELKLNRFHIRENYAIKTSWASQSAYLWSRSIDKAGFVHVSFFLLFLLSRSTYKVEPSAPLEDGFCVNNGAHLGVITYNLRRRSFTKTKGKNKKEMKLVEVSS